MYKYLLITLIFSTSLPVGAASFNCPIYNPQQLRMIEQASFERERRINFEYLMAEPKALKGQGYNGDRPLSKFTDEPTMEKTLGRGFISQLNNLKENQRALFRGTGDSRAAQDYLQSGGKAEVVGLVPVEPSRIPYERVRFAEFKEKFSEKFVYLKGLILEMNPTFLGKFDLMVDVGGETSRHEDLSGIMNRDLELLKVGGTAHYSIPKASVNIKTADGQNISVKKWLEETVGAKVEVTPKGHYITITVTKTSDFYTVPTLTLVGLQAGPTTIRSYIAN